MCVFHGVPSGDSQIDFSDEMASTSGGKIQCVMTPDRGDSEYILEPYPKFARHPDVTFEIPRWGRHTLFKLSCMCISNSLFRSSQTINNCCRPLSTDLKRCNADGNHHGKFVTVLEIESRHGWPPHSTSAYGDIPILHRYEAPFSTGQRSSNSSSGTDTLASTCSRPYVSGEMMKLGVSRAILEV
jgi:hypothetical protein